MSIQTQITRINGNVQGTLSILSAAGISVPSGANSDHLEALVDEAVNGDIDCGTFTDASSTNTIDAGTF